MNDLSEFVCSIDHSGLIQAWIDGSDSCKIDDGAKSKFLPDVCDNQCKWKPRIASQEENGFASQSYN